MKMIHRPIALAAALLLLSGCATNNPKDPLEPVNRAVFTFNDKVDQVALKPAATAYKKVTPSFVQTGVSNFFGNLGDIWSSANNLMQGKGEAGMSDFARVMINTSFGIGGLFDIASEAGIRKHREDFGQTLGYWGVPSGPYVMLPLLGPSTVRDTAALPVDIAADPWVYVTPTNLRNIGSATRIVDERAALLDASNLMEEAALDRYEFIRDGYLQRRQGQVFDGQGSRQEAQEEARLNAEDARKAAETAAPAAPAGGAPASGASNQSPAPATSGDKPVSSEPGVK